MLASDLTVHAYAEKGYVKRVLAGWTGPELDCSAVFPRGRMQSPKVRAFVDFLVERLNFEADYMHMLCPNQPLPNKAKTGSPASVAQQLARAAEWNAAVGAMQRDPEPETSNETG